MSIGSKLVLACTCALAFACSSSSGDDDSGGNQGTGGTTAGGTGGVSSGTGGVGTGSGGMTGSGMGTGGHTGSGGMTASGSGGMTASGSGGMTASGSGGMTGSGGMGTDGGMSDSGTMMDGSTSGGGGNDVTSTISGYKPVLHGFATTNGPETLIYLTSADFQCSDIMTMGAGWLTKVPADDFVIEIVIPGTAMVGTKMVGFLVAELNYAFGGGTPNANEHSADSGTITFTKAESKGVFEGTIMGSYPAGTIMGSFHADWCEGGSEY